jgi:hypothetical protein
MRWVVVCGVALALAGAVTIGIARGQPQADNPADPLTWCLGEGFDQRVPTSVCQRASISRLMASRNAHQAEDAARQRELYDCENRFAASGYRPRSSDSLGPCGAILARPYGPAAPP